MVLLEAPDDVADRTRDEEVLLLESELLTLRGVIGGVEDARDRLARHLLFHGLAEVAAVEELQVELRRCARRPKPQGVDRAVAEAGYRDVVRDADHALR